MAKKLQLRRGTTSQHSSFTGAVGEVTVDTDKKTAVVHDGSTAGGVPLATAADVTAKAPSATPTFTGLSTFTGQVNLNNDAGLFINGDIYVRRDSTANKNYIECTHVDKHDLVIEVQDGKSVILQTDDGSSGYETLAKFQGDGAAELYHNNVKKIETASGGVTVTGTVTTTAGVLGVGDAVLANDQTWTGAQSGAITSLSTSSNTTAVNLGLGNNYSLTLNENSTLAQPSNYGVGQSGSIFITQDGTGSRTLAYHADWKWAGGTAPTLSTAAASVDRIDYIVAATNKIHAVATLAVA